MSFSEFIKKSQGIPEDTELNENIYVARKGSGGGHGYLDDFLKNSRADSCVAILSTLLQDFIKEAEKSDDNARRLVLEDVFNYITSKVK